MNLIGNCCISNFIEKLCNQPHTNPFTWVDLDFESMLALITDWNLIRWDNIKLEEHKHPHFDGYNIYWIVVDNKVRIQYVHYLFDLNASKPTINGCDVRYNKIWEYIIQKYISRVKRMISQPASQPAFVIEWGHLDYNNETNWQRLLRNPSPYKIAVITRGYELHSSNPNILLITDDTNIPSPLYYANKYHNEIIQWLYPPSN